MTTVQAIRTFFFYLLLSSSSFFWCIFCVFIAPFLPFRARYRLVIQTWCRCATWLAKVVAGIHYEVRGLENIPQQPCVILAKHQSTWETFYLSALFEPLSQVVKRELLRVPFFGWGMALLKPIAIDRSNPKAALKQLAKQGDERIKQGAWVLIFPEGTRIRSREIKPEVHGGFALIAQMGKAPVNPLAICGWSDITPAGKKLMRPKKCWIRAGKAVSLSDAPAGLKRTERLEWFESEAMNRVYAMRDELCAEHPGRF